jgi:very-short-patch-repair endonuclease
MRTALLTWAAEQPGSVFTRAEALARYPAHVLDDAVQDGALVRLLPCTYALPDLASTRWVSRRAALAYRPDAALAGLDALDVWSVLGEPTASGPVQLVTDERHRESNVSSVLVSRRSGFRNSPPDVVVRRGLRVTRLEQTIVDAWRMLPAIDRRAPALVAVRERRTTAARLLEALAASGRVAGAAEMRHVFGLIGSGCHSPLELWGHESVFTAGELRVAQCQVRVELRTGVIYLDRYYEEAMVNVELDGAAYHGSPGQRERDIARDAALATMGIQTIRYSHPRLFGDIAGVRAETLAVLEMRRRQFGLTA